MPKSVTSEHGNDKHYLDEKELFILYTIVNRRGISTVWSNVFTPNAKQFVPSPNGFADIATLEDQISEAYQASQEKIQSKMRSHVILSQLLKLGKDMDSKGFILSCNADYALVDGGFLCCYTGNTMKAYLEDSDENRASADDYKVLNKEQRDFLDDVIKGKNLDGGRFSKLADSPVEAYREAILEGNADADFIELVNKLVTEYDGGRWDRDDAEKFLEVYFRHNKEHFRWNLEGKSLLYEDSQTKLAKLIFEGMEIVLAIKNKEKIIKHLAQYMAWFTNDELDGMSKHGLTGQFFSESINLVPLHSQFFGFKKQKEILLKHVERRYDEFKRDDLEISHPYEIPEYVGGNAKDTVAITAKSKEHDLFLFVHTMIALEYEGYFQIEDFFYGTKGIFDPYDRGFVFKVRLNHQRIAKDEVARDKSSLESVASPRKSDKKTKVLTQAVPLKTVVFIKSGKKDKPVYRFYVNDDLEDVRDLRSDSGRLKKLVRIAQDGRAGYDKGLLDYINSNVKCALYCGGKYAPTKILEKQGDTLRVRYGIKVKVVGEAEYKKKINKKNRA